MKVVKGYVHHDGSVGVLVQFEVGSDFTVRTEEFQHLATQVCLSLALWMREEGDPETLHSSGIILPGSVSMIDEADGTNVEEALVQASKKFKEKISISNVSFLLGD